MGRLTNFAPITDGKIFDEVYNGAKKWHCSCAVIYFLADNENRFSAVASKKIGNAVKRNRAKRLLRAAFVSIKGDLADGIYILIAKKQIIDMKFHNIEKELNWAFRKIGSKR